jgi:hypothetical protein
VAEGLGRWSLEALSDGEPQRVQRPDLSSTAAGPGRCRSWAASLAEPAPLETQRQGSACQSVWGRPEEIRPGRPCNQGSIDPVPVTRFSPTPGNGGKRHLTAESNGDFPRLADPIPKLLQRVWTILAVFPRAYYG